MPEATSQREPGQVAEDADDKADQHQGDVGTGAVRKQGGEREGEGEVGAPARIIIAGWPRRWHPHP